MKGRGRLCCPNSLIWIFPVVAVNCDDDDDDDDEDDDDDDDDEKENGSDGRSDDENIWKSNDMYNLRNPYFHVFDISYLFKVNNRNTRSRSEIWSMLTVKTPEQCHRDFSLTSLMLALNRFHTLI